MFHLILLFLRGHFLHHIHSTFFKKIESEPDSWTSILYTISFSFVVGNNNNLLHSRLGLYISHEILEERTINSLVKAMIMYLILWNPCRTTNGLPDEGSSIGFESSQSKLFRVNSSILYYTMICGLRLRLYVSYEFAQECTNIYCSWGVYILCEFVVGSTNRGV